MEAAKIRALRQRLQLSVAQLGEKLGAAPATVTQWERGECFPTKAHLARLRDLDAAANSEAGPAPRGGDSVGAPFLASPELGALLRKLLFHPELRRKALDLAQAYPDPADG